MTDAEASLMFDRLIVNGFVPPPDREDNPGAVLREWADHYRHVAVEDMHAAITKLADSREDRFWPLPGELKAFLPRHEPSEHGKCPTCHGTKWIEAPPFTANGLDAHGKPRVYDNVVQRCPDCGTPPPPEDRDLGERRTPVTGPALDAWKERRLETDTTMLTKEQFLAKLQEMKVAFLARAAMPTTHVGRHQRQRQPPPQREPGEDG